MTVCFFGFHDPSYSRNRVLRLGFERNGWEIVDIRIDPRRSKGLKKYWSLMREGMRARTRHFDMVIVCFPGQAAVPLARLIFGKRIIFDAFVSLYDSNVQDRKLYGRHDPRAIRDWFLDAFSCRLASRILLDTHQHIDYFVRTFHLNRKRFIRMFVGADEEVFMPRPHKEHEGIIVHFHGTFIPLQGIQCILSAADKLRSERDIRFRIIGAGQESKMAAKFAEELHLTNVEFTGKTSLDGIAASMSEADIVLGIFGNTQKTLRVIPNKVYEAMAMGKAVITANTPAVFELPDAGQTLHLIPAGDAGALANAIRTLSKDAAYRERLGSKARALFKAQLLSSILISQLLDDINRVQQYPAAGIA